MKTRRCQLKWLCRVNVFDSSAHAPHQIAPHERRQQRRAGNAAEGVRIAVELAAGDAGGSTSPIATLGRMRRLCPRRRRSGSSGAGRMARQAQAQCARPMCSRRRGRVGEQAAGAGGDRCSPTATPLPVSPTSSASWPARLAAASSVRGARHCGSVSTTSLSRARPTGPASACTARPGARGRRDRSPRAAPASRPGAKGQCGFTHR